jgi:beta-glucanase (GH16 family)
MRKVIKLILVMLCAVVLVTDGVIAEYKLVWSDEFNGTGVNKKNWKHEVYPGVISNSEEAAYYTDRAANSFVKDGNLVIAANKEKYEDNNYTSARLNTFGKFDFLYGKIEARIKLPKEEGFQSKVWLMPSSLEYGGWPSSGEIDIFRARSADSFVSGIIFRSGFSNNEYVTKKYDVPKEQKSLADDYHVYGLEWQPYEMRWYIDGRLYAVQNRWASPNVGYPAPFDKPFYLVLNVAALGDVTDDTVTWPVAMYVDWIRVYQAGGNKPPQVKITSPANKAKLPGGDIVVETTASDPDGNLEKVEFYNDDQFIGEVNKPPYTFRWAAGDGCYKIVVRAIDKGNFVCADSVEVESGIGCPPKPFHGKPSDIPGRIEAEDFDESVKRESYSDRDPTNNGGVYRNTGVDIQPCSEGGFDVCWMETGEWIQYTVNVTKTGRYDICCRVGSPNSTAKLHIEFNGVNKTGSMAVPLTGDWQKYTDLIVRDVELAAGVQTMKVVVEFSGLNLNYIEITPAKDK